MRTLEIAVETFPVRGAFVIARGSRTETTVVTVALSEAGQRGRGECVPYAHYRETPESVVAQIQGLTDQLEAGADRRQLLRLLPAGAARNAVDATLWDLEAKLLQTSVATLAEIAPLTPVRSARTLSLGTPEDMAAEARALLRFEVLKLKLDGGDDCASGDDLARVRAVHEAAPDARLIVDANESWEPEQVEERLGAFAELGVEMVEQPLAAEHDPLLAEIDRVLPICADESFHVAEDLDRIDGRYDIVNVKLDKTGGLTHALEAARLARKRGLGLMVGCMLGTSLGMAPALVVAQRADWVDLDGPYLLARDREPGLDLSDDGVVAANAALWG